VGLHHQYADPGITNIYKAVHAFFTFMVAAPSLITAFTVAASLEYAGRQRGGNRLFGWWLKISGIVNSSYNMNQVVRNTSWIAGHFHLTVGSAVFLTFLGLSIYLLNKLFGKKVFSNTLSVLGAYMWLIGVLIFSWGMMQVSRAGIPRRTNLGFSPYITEEERILMVIAAVGGIIMFISFVIFLINFLGTLFGKKEENAEVVELDYDFSPVWDNWKVWIGIAVFIRLL